MSQMRPGQRVLVRALAEDPAEGIERNLSLEPMDPPDPAALGPRDVIIEVRSAQVGWVDLLMTSGQYQHMPPLPYTPGLEYAGVVAWTGPEVKDLRPGDAVYNDGLLSGPRSLGAYQAYGGFATYAVAPAEAVRRVPAGLSFDQACNLLGSYETAYHCLIACGQVQAGETVLIHGASGATGLAAVHLCKLLGAKVIATGRSAEKLAVVKAQGADHVIRCAPDEAPLREQVKAIAGEGVDVVYDGVGGEISVASLRCVRFGARYLIVGWAATPNVARGKGGRGAPNANQLPTNLILMKGLKVLGCPMVISTVRDPALRPPRLQRILRWVEEGRIRPHVSHALPLAAFREAMRAKWQGAVIGGCAVNP